jgi:hypothetical protein
LRQRVALVATLARLYVGVVLIDRECECRGHRRRIVGVVYDHMCQQQCDQRIGYAAGLRPGNMSQIGARSAYLALRDFDPANVSCGSNSEVAAVASQVCSAPNNRHSPLERTGPFAANSGHPQTHIVNARCSFTEHVKVG